LFKQVYHLTVIYMDILLRLFFFFKKIRDIWKIICGNQHYKCDRLNFWISEYI